MFLILFFRIHEKFKSIDFLIEIVSVWINVRVLAWANVHNLWKVKVAKLVGWIPIIVDYLSGEDVVLEPVKRNPQLKHDYDATHKLSRRLVNYFLSFKIHVTHSETVCIYQYIQVLLTVTWSNLLWIEWWGNLPSKGWSWSPLLNLIRLADQISKRLTTVNCTTIL